jgi:phage-related holin
MLIFFDFIAVEQMFRAFMSKKTSFEPVFLNRNRIIFGLFVILFSIDMDALTGLMGNVRQGMPCTYGCYKKRHCEYLFSPMDKAGDSQI